MRTIALVTSPDRKTAMTTPFRVLVAEDNRAMGNVLAFALEREGYDVTLARSGTAAIEASRENTFDFVLTDHQMPGASGIELCEHLRSQPEHRNVPILFCSAKGFELDADRMRDELGIIDIALKPFSTHEIVKTVRTSLQGTAVPSEPVPALATGR